MNAVNLLELAVGARVRLLDGAVAEVVDNPRDGTWLFCRFLESPTDPSRLDGGEHMVFAQDVVSLA